jgi:hypothetical protein
MSKNKQQQKNYKQFSITKLEDALVSLGSLISGVVVNLKKYKQYSEEVDVLINKYVKLDEETEEEVLIPADEYDDINDLIIGYKSAMFDMDYEIIKINGTATFADQKKIIELRKDIKQKLWQQKDNTTGSLALLRQETWLLEFIYLYQLYVSGKTNNTHLSFAFDDNYPSDKITNCIDNIIKRTDVLVIIGYTFPFFNRDTDRKILQYIKPNTKIYIQDLTPERIKQSLTAVLPNFPEEQIFLRKDVDQFFLPPEL